MAQWIEDPQERLEVEKVTKEMKLPVWKANHKGKFRDFWNELWDKIEDYVVKLKGDTEKNSKGLNDRLVSAVGKHDGDFPIANAVVGNVYYSELTKKYYKCKVGGPAPMPNGNFIDLSILENLNRLENLSTYTNLGFGKSTIVSIANFCIETISVAGVAGIRTANITTNFKKIIAVTLTPYITQGQNDPSLMTQVAHNSYNYVLENKKINIYATGSQTIEVTIFGLV